MNMETQALALSLLLSASVPLLPNGWSLARDSASGKFYYYNTSTGAVQWDPPPVAEGSAPQVDPAAVQSTANALMAAGAKRGADGTPALSAAGVLLGGAGALPPRDTHYLCEPTAKVQHLLAPPWRLQCVRVRACVCVCVVVPQRTP